MNKTTREQTEYVIANIGILRPSEICRRTGMRQNVVHEIIRRHKAGLPQSYIRFEEAQRKRDYIAQNWGNKSVREIANDLRFSSSLTLDIACSMGLITPEERDAEKENFRRCKFDALSSESLLKKKAETIKKKYRMERFRMMSGLPQETKWRVSLIPKRIRGAMWRIVRKYNYFKPDTDTCTLYYDSQTKRLPNDYKYNEEYYIKKYGIEFVEGED